MAIAGLADAIDLGGEKKRAKAEPEAGESSGSGADMAADDAFDAIKSGDRSAFRSALKDFVEMCSAPAAEEGDEGAGY